MAINSGIVVPWSRLPLHSTRRFMSVCGAVTWTGSKGEGEQNLSYKETEKDTQKTLKSADERLERATKETVNPCS